MESKRQRLEWLLAKRDALEETGRYISRTQQKEIIKLRAELINDLEDETVQRNTY